MSKIGGLGLFQESAGSIMRKTPHLKPWERLLRLATLDRHQTNRIGRVQRLETRPRRSATLDYPAKGTILNLRSANLTKQKFGTVLFTSPCNHKNTRPMELNLSKSGTVAKLVTVVGQAQIRVLITTLTER